MKALLSINVGGPETLELRQIDDPVAGREELLVDVEACGINFPDVLIIADKYQFKPARPFAPGSEIAGVVAAVGEGVEGWSVGDRMIGTMLGSGGLAEKAVVKASSAFHLPERFDFVSAAGLLLTYATAIYALKDRGNLRPGETLLVLGAAGGVGMASIEVGLAMGARVVAAVSSDDKAQAVLEAGASDVLVYPRDLTAGSSLKELASRFKVLVGSGGANVILDPVGGDYVDPALRSIAWGGRYLVVGFPAGIARVPLNLVLIKGCSIVGVFQGDFGERCPEHNAANVQQLLGWWKGGLIRPRITRSYLLSEGADAIAHMASRKAVGKLVVKIR